MGRYSTGVWQTREAMRIELSYLLKHKYIEKGPEGTYKRGILRWSCRGESTGSITIISCYNDKEAWLRLIYTVTERDTGEKKELDYKIYLETVPSNLGKGEVLYFICPISGKRCRILYKAYGYERWKSREAYQNRLYYEGQACSKYLRHNERYFKAEENLQELYKKRRTTTYKGKITKRSQRLELLEMKVECLDNMRWNPKNLPINLRGLIDFYR